DPRAPRETDGRKRVRVARHGRRGARMSCRELERLWDAGASLPETRAHQAGCPECGRAGDVLAQTVSALHSLKAPAWSPMLRRALLAIPRRAVSGGGAEPLLALALEGDGSLSAADDARLQNHLSRCESCAETAKTLFQLRELSAPPPPP